MQSIIEPILVAISLCADCFAVSLCSSVTLRKASPKDIFVTAFAFSAIQAGLLTVGYLFGSLFIGLIETISHIIGFLLLLYVGGSMLLEAFRNEESGKDLNGWKNIILGGVATSIDALAVGVAESMKGTGWSAASPLIVAVFVVTMISVVAGISLGKSIGHSGGHSLGRWAEILGGIVLIGIGVDILLG